MSISRFWITSLIGMWSTSTSYMLLDLVGVDALAHRQVALRVEVDAEDVVPGLGEGDGQVQGRRRLGDAALLVGEADHPGAALVILVGAERREWMRPLGGRSHDVLGPQANLALLVVVVGSLRLGHGGRIGRHQVRRGRRVAASVTRRPPRRDGLGLAPGRSSAAGSVGSAVTFSSLPVPSVSSSAIEPFADPGRSAGSRHRCVRGGRRVAAFAGLRLKSPYDGAIRTVTQAFLLVNATARARCRGRVASRLSISDFWS